MTVPSPGPPHSADPSAPRQADHAVRQTVAAALAGLDGLAQRPLAEHVEVYERVHAALGEALTERSAGGASIDTERSAGGASIDTERSAGGASIDTAGSA